MGPTPKTLSPKQQARLQKKAARTSGDPAVIQRRAEAELEQAVLEAKQAGVSVDTRRLSREAFALYKARRFGDQSGAWASVPVWR